MIKASDFLDYIAEESRSEKIASEYKSASEIVEESYEKIAGVGSLVKGLIGASKMLPKNSSNLYKGVSNMVKKDIGIKSIVNNKTVKNNAKNVAKGLALPAAGVATAVGAKALLGGKKQETPQTIQSNMFPMY